MTNLKRSLISLFFAVGLASATNSAGASQHDATSVVAQHAPAFVSQVPSFDSPTKKFNHAVVSAAPVPGAFVTPTQFAHSMPTLVPSTGRSQQPLAGGAPIRMESNRASRPNGNAPATAATKSAQHAPAANSAGVAKHPVGKNFPVAIAVAALAASAASAASAAAAHAAAIIAADAGAAVVREVDTAVTKVDADAAVADVVGAATTVADLAVSAATTVADLAVSAATTAATTVAHAAATTRSRAATTAAAAAAAAAVDVDVVARVDMADTVVDTVDMAGINA
ncbi:hypothetical protein GGI19_003201 [Coemansia pectinata]|uniref:Uncharacterized protein n=1 Tax=Coemansia pectinata TaxID=1052879 RepID=A0A9W8H060_9FUNG|nr:hypothetical protein GGI19_003201 [Coemansia pectinata]